MANGIINKKPILSGTISTTNALTGSVSAGGGSTDHNRLTNRDKADQHPIEAITDLREELDSKLDSNTALPLIEEAVQNKAKGLYFDAKKELAKKSYWYLTAEIDPKTKMGTKDSIISGPYDLGAGGGSGGGGVTKVSIRPTKWPSTVVVGSKTIFSVTWSSTIGDAQEPTGDGTFYVSVNGKQVLVLPNKSQGIVELDLSDYLIAGTNNIQIKVLDAYGTTGTLVRTTSAVTLELKSSFNETLNFKNFINYTYVPYGDVEKTVYFIVDGKEKGNQVVKSTGEQQTYRIEGLSHGSHTLEVYFTATINGELVTSNKLFYDLVYYIEGNITPIIVSTFTELEQEQYIAFNIPYRVYIDGRNEFEVSFLVNEEEINKTTIGTSEQYWNYVNNTPGNYKLTIKCGNITKDFNIYIKPTTINVTPVVQDLALALNTQGRNNNEDLSIRAQWKDEKNNIDCSLTNFNWKSNGWVSDIDGNTVLRVSGDARVTIPYKAFETDFKNSGKTIELEIATSAVRNYSTTLISCLDKQSTDFYETSTSFAEEDFRRYTFKVNLDVSKIKDENDRSKLTPGSHVFSYTTNGWMLDSESSVTLEDYGISISQYELNPEGTHPEEYLLIGDNIIINYTLAARGFYVTPQVAGFRSQQSFISTQYKEEEHVRLSFVIEKNTENRIIWMYINGIASGAMQYPVDDNFRQLESNVIEIGSNDAILDIYNIRIYDNSLTSKQIVNNWIADTQSIALKAARFARNDNYNDKNELIISKLPVGLPYIIWDIQPLPEFKGDKRLGNAIYVDPKDSSRNFTSEHAQYNVQGTSSSVYPTKNIRIKFKAKDDDPNFFWINDNGDIIKKFPITYPGGIGDNYFTFKVDYASSEGANNVELTKLYNDTCIEMGILTPPQRKDLKVRVGIDGFPIAAFYRTEDGKDIFCTKANFNNDKANEDVYGFEDGDESWETTNNSADETKYKVPSTEENFENGFEIRFPDSDDWNGDVSKLQAMTTWVASTNRDLATNEELDTPVTYTYKETTLGEDNSESTKEVTKTFTHDTKEYRLIKFRAELADWFSVDSTLFYYVFTHLYLMIDSRAKNAFPTYFKSRQAGDGGDRWFWIPYDMDTAIGIDNKGKLSFDYNLEDTDQLDGADVYNGQDSVMWCNLRDSMPGEIKAMYAKMRLSKLISYEETEKRFEEHQGQWSESIFNEDAKNKYIAPLANGDNYLEMLQGSKAQQRKWWLYNRFKYMDSKYNAGEAIKDFIQFRAYVDSGVEKPNITITPYADIYATVSYANGRVVAKRAKRNEQIIIENPFSTAETENDQETYIYSASQLKSIGDISGFHPDTVKIGNAVKLQELKVGDKSESYSNPYLKELTVGGNTLLKSIDARNCINLGTGVTSAPDLSQCINIEEIYFTGTKIKGIILPDGGNIKKLHLPGTLTSLTIKNQPLLTDLNIEGTNTTLNIPVTNPDTYTIVGKVISKTDWADSANLVLSDGEAQINLVLTDKDIYDQLVLGETSLVINCNTIEVRYDLINSEIVTLVDYTIADINTVTLNSENLFDSIKTAIDYVTANVVAPSKEDYGTSLIESLWLENIPSESIKSETMVGKMKPNTAIRLIGINENYNTYDEIKQFYDILDTKKGLTSDGETVDKAQVTGTINIPRITYAQYIECLERYPEIKINATQIICTVNFINNNSIHSTQNVVQGTEASKPTTPIKASTQQYYYIFDKWIYEDGSTWQPTDIITKNITLTAIYIQKVQQYTVTFDPNSDIIVVEPTSLTLFYGSKFEKPTILNIPDGVELQGWFISENEAWDFENYELTENIKLIAKWKDEKTPTVKIFKEDYNHFKYEATDNLGIVGWAHTVDDEEPVWNEIVSTTSLVGNCEVTRPGINIFWIIDSNSNIAKASITACNVDVVIDTENDDTNVVSYKIYEEGFEEKVISNVALANTKLKLTAIIDSHYENLIMSINDDILSEEDSYTINSNIKVLFKCSPKVYKLYFDLNGKGTYVAPQEVIYRTLGTKPLDQYYQPTSEVIYSWYTDKNYTKIWDFTQDIVLGETVLYAKWMPYHEPSIFTIIIPEDAEANTEGRYEIEVNFTHGTATQEADLVKVDFGDGIKRTDNRTSPVHLRYEYDSPGEKIIKIYGNNKGYSLGNNYEYQIINPCKYLVKAELAWDLPKLTHYSFKGASITEFPLTEYLTSIAIGAFAACNKVKKLELPLSITTIEDNAFEECEELEGTITLPKSLTKIGNYAFNRCSKITGINFECNQIRALGDRTFASCTSLEEVEIPDFITSIGDSCFAFCTGLEKLKLPNPKLNIGHFIVQGCTGLKTAGPIGSVDSEGYPVNIEYAWMYGIPDYAFAAGQNQSYLIECVLPDTLIMIGDSAFLNTRLSTIEFPASLTQIKQNAFSYSTLAAVTIPPTIKDLGASVFSGCINLQDVKIYTTNVATKVYSAETAWFALSNVNLCIQIQKSIMESPQLTYGPFWNYFNESTPLSYKAIED